jgi:hypothetical protein
VKELKVTKVVDKQIMLTIALNYNQQRERIFQLWLKVDYALAINCNHP